MNALNILSARIIRPNPPDTSSSGHSSELARTRSWSSLQQRRRSRAEARRDGPKAVSPGNAGLDSGGDGIATKDYQGDDGVPIVAIDEKSPLMGAKAEADLKVRRSVDWKLIPKKIADALVASIRWILSSLAAPGVYLVACLYDETGSFSPLLPARKMGRVVLRRRGARSTAQDVGVSAALHQKTLVSRSDEKPAGPQRMKSSSSWRPSFRRSTSSGAASLTDDGQLETSSEKTRDAEYVSGRTRSKSPPSSSSDESISGRRSIRIKVHNEDGQKRRRARKVDSTGFRSAETSSTSLNHPPPLTPATLKSPTSPASSLGMTRYPRAPAPPRPLIPRRQPSYSFSNPDLPGPTLKTLILDLDETLIHSLAKGGRMSTGHMVEVKLNAPVALSGGIAHAPQHPILYYVHKRPHCDDFLRKICKWYNLVVFTASVQEYADPVIDWLEQDRKYFSGRYYRQHCTFRSGNYIKDISCVEPDLSKVMIVDNSPASYVFHEDNAIPIEGWINDPTDNDLLHLVPLLEGLQYVTDVRALLALRMGEVTTMSTPSSTAAGVV